MHFPGHKSIYKSRASAWTRASCYNKSSITEYAMNSISMYPFLFFLGGGFAEDGLKQARNDSDGAARVPLGVQ